MSILPWVGITLLTIASLAALRQMVRAGESRWWLLSALLALLTTQITIAFLLEPDARPVPPVGTAEGITLAVTCALGLLVAIAYARTATERDRAETLHWESMEMIRALGDLRANLDEDAELHEMLERVLDLGRKRFGAEIGLVSVIHGERYEVIASRSPHHEGLSRGSVLPLSETFCERTFAAQRTLAFSNIENPVWSDHPAKLALGFRSYLGAVVRVGSGRFGTLCFANSKAAHTPYTATQRDLAGLLAQWIGFEIDRAVASKIVWNEVAAATRGVCNREELLPAMEPAPNAAPFAGLDIDLDIELKIEAVSDVLPDAASETLSAAHSEAPPKLVDATQASEPAAVSTISALDDATAPAPSTQLSFLT